MHPETEACLVALRSAAASFRLGMEAQGNDVFVGFIDACAQLLAKGELTADVAAVLPEIVSAQVRGDYLCVADLLEYQILPLLWVAATEAAEKGS